MNSIVEILDDLKKGKMIVLVDGRDRENEGDLICAAEKATPKIISFMARFGRGLICAPLTASRAKKLKLKALPVKNPSRLQHCNFTVSTDARYNISTGSSAFDRAHTIRVLADEKTTPDDLSQPGHIFPLIGKDGGVLQRPGHTEGTLELLRLAGLSQIGVLCEIMGDDGRMLKDAKLRRFCHTHNLKICTIQDIIESQIQKSRTQKSLTHRPSRSSAKQLMPSRGWATIAVETRLPTAYGQFKMRVYVTPDDGKEHIALIMGNPLKHSSVLVRIHSECLTGDMFQSHRCDCYSQLTRSLQNIAGAKSGVLLYLRHEGRGIGLVNKLKAYNLQDRGYNTVAANKKLGFAADVRDYSIAAEILKDLKISSVRLITNNPQKIAQLKREGITVLTCNS